MDKGVRRPADLAKQGGEDVEFPILCETCLGDNPYVRMSREPFGSACHVCARPMSKFRWKAGSGGRFKQTVVCAACAKMKNVCMCCILDLTYGVPVEVRDRVVTQAIAGQLGIPGGPGGEGVSLAGGGGGSSAPLALPGSITAPLLGYNAGGATAVSDYNRAYAMVTAEQAEAKGGAVVPYSGLASVAPAAHEALLRLGRNKPRYDRNAAKLCSFFARGECKRGSECPYRHEMPADKAEGLSKQNYKDRYYGTEDPVANKMLSRLAARDAEAAGEGGAGGAGGSGGERRPHASDADPSAVTLWIGKLEPSAGVSADELRAALILHGEILSLQLSERSGSAFVEFSTHEQALGALSALHARGGLRLRGQCFPVSWSKPKGERSERGDRGDRERGGERKRPRREEREGGSGAAASSAEGGAGDAADGAGSTSSAGGAAAAAPGMQPPPHPMMMHPGMHQHMQMQQQQMMMAMHMQQQQYMQQMQAMQQQGRGAPGPGGWPPHSPYAAPPHMYPGYGYPPHYAAAAPPAAAPASATAAAPAAGPATAVSAAPAQLAAAAGEGSAAPSDSAAAGPASSADAVATSEGASGSAGAAAPGAAVAASGEAGPVAAAVPETAAADATAGASAGAPASAAAPAAWPPAPAQPTQGPAIAVAPWALMAQSAAFSFGAPAPAAAGAAAVPTALSSSSAAAASAAGRAGASGGPVKRGAAQEEAAARRKQGQPVGSNASAGAGAGGEGGPARGAADPMPKPQYPSQHAGATGTADA